MINLIFKCSHFIWTNMKLIKFMNMRTDNRRTKYLIIILIIEINFLFDLLFSFHVEHHNSDE